MFRLIFKVLWVFVVSAIRYGKNGSVNVKSVTRSADQVVDALGSEITALEAEAKRGGK